METDDVKENEEKTENGEETKAGEQEKSGENGEVPMTPGSPSTADNTAASMSALNGSAPETPEISLDKDDPMSASSLRQKNFSFTSPSGSISKDFGTPILVRDKSFKSLPGPDKFNDGIQEHINFENLPDSAGTFEKMRNLFAKIKEKVGRKK